MVFGFYPECHKTDCGLWILSRVSQLPMDIIFYKSAVSPLSNDAHSCCLHLGCVYVGLAVQDLQLYIFFERQINA